MIRDMYRVIGQNMSVQHVQEDTLHHEMPRDLNTFFTGPIYKQGVYS